MNTTLPYITDAFIEAHCNFSELISALKVGFANPDLLVPMRHHHDYPNPVQDIDSTLLLMPAFNPGKELGIKIVTVSPNNGVYNMPAIQGMYLFLDGNKGNIKAILEAKSLTAKRTAAASALASSFLSRTDSRSLLMIGTGALSINLIKAHAAVRPIETVYVWGRDFEKAQSICNALKDESFSCTPIKSIEEKVKDVDIISTATLSPTPLIKGEWLQDGQHLDLVGAYKKDTREADNEAVKKSEIYIDTYQGGLKESGDIVIPLNTGVLEKETIKADLFELCTNKKQGRTNNDSITFFKSVGHALEDLVAASYFFNLTKGNSDL
ncbi:ornithine cyclodeaminase family protein [Neotamlana nanhaiensis]|uniref:ornithine cyclodeaminase family protein n=1 Tax=Neotamlana nanhaiensis TaxID=1382798 RepID=UPI0009E3E497|nr:ornithine cyclodeaminase family protein [Tamlana nanhaiensis]